MVGFVLPGLRAELCTVTAADGKRLCCGTFGMCLCGWQQVVLFLCINSEAKPTALRKVPAQFLIDLIGETALQ